MTSFKDLYKDNDDKGIKEYILDVYKTRKPEKPVWFYVNICILYKKYPETIEEILDKINILGYYKDYIHILKVCNNNELIERIYQRIAKIYLNDLNNYKNKKPITTISKWLPRETSKINKQINFVDKFTEYIYPNYDKIKRRTIYRKNNSELNKHLGTVEVFICSNKLEEIDFYKMSEIALKRYYNKFITNEKTKTKFITFLYDKYLNMSIYNIIKKFIKGEFDDIQKKLIQKIWNINSNKYIEDAFKGIEEIKNKIMKSENNIIILDIPTTIYNSPILVKLILTILVIIEINNNNKIIINSKNPYEIKLTKEMNILNKIEHIIGNIKTYDTINIENIVINEELIIIFTNKENKLNKIKNEIIYWRIDTMNPEIKKEENQIELKGNKIKYETKSKNYRIIYNIINKSRELNNNIFKKYILLLIIIVVIYYFNMV